MRYEEPIHAIKRLLNNVMNVKFIKILEGLYTYKDERINVLRTMLSTESYS